MSDHLAAERLPKLGPGRSSRRVDSRIPHPAQGAVEIATRQARHMRVGAGTEFVVHLPVVDVIQETETATQRPQLTRGLKVLLVEDNADAAALMAAALEMLGCHVVVGDARANDSA